MWELSALNSIINDLIVEPFDHTFLNKDIPYFANCVPTAENIALHISDKLINPINAIGANAVITKDVAENAVMVGIPARSVGIADSEFKPYGITPDSEIGRASCRERV